MSQAVKLSVVVITFNEEKNIGRCLESVKTVADEIVVVDSFSTDSTEKICSDYNVVFEKHEFEGHIEQKNYAMSRANNDFILSVDADEALSGELIQSVNKVKHNWTGNAYSMNRLSNYCGKWIRHCGWYPDTKLRLFDRRVSKWGGMNPHDRLETKGKTSLLQGNLLHYTYYTIEEHLAQVDRFTTIAANSLIAVGKKSNWFMVWIYPGIRFIQSYIFRLGILDGYFGYKICAISAYSTHLKYAKIKSHKKNIKA